MYFNEGRDENVYVLERRFCRICQTKTKHTTWWLCTAACKSSFIVKASCRAFFSGACFLDATAISTKT